MKTNTYQMHQDTRLALLEQSIGHINETMMRFEKRFDSIDKRFNEVDKRFDELEKKMESGFNRLDNDIKINFKYTITTLLTLFVSSGLIPIITQAVQKFIH